MQENRLEVPLEIPYTNSMKNKNNIKNDILALLKQVAEDQHYEAKEGDPRPYSKKLIKELYSSYIDTILIED